MVTARKVNHVMRRLGPEPGAISRSSGEEGGWGWTQSRGQQSNQPRLCGDIPAKVLDMETGKLPGR